MLFGIYMRRNVEECLELKSRTYRGGGGGGTFQTNLLLGWNETYISHSILILNYMAQHSIEQHFVQLAWHFDNSHFTFWSTHQWQFTFNTISIILYSILTNYKAFWQFYQNFKKGSINLPPPSKSKPLMHLQLQMICFVWLCLCLCIVGGR